MVSRSSMNSRLVDLEEQVYHLRKAISELVDVLFHSGIAQPQEDNNVKVRVPVFKDPAPSTELEEVEE